MPVGDMIRRSATRSPKKTALIFKDKRMTYEALNRRVNSLGNRLLDMGGKKGDRAAVLMHNCPEYIEAYFACAKSGVVFVPVNNLLKQYELRQILHYIEPRFLFLDSDFEALVGSVTKGMDFVEFMISLGACPRPPYVGYEDVVSKGSSEEPQTEISKDDVMSIFLTSGTTGLPKGAIRTHHQNYQNAMTCALEMKLDTRDRAVLLFPLYHVTFEDHTRHFLMGNTVVIRREGAFDPKEVLEILSTEKITTCQFVPTMINAMLQEEGIETYDLSRLRLIPYAASPMPVELLKRAMKRFKCSFIQFYGQTETGPLTTVLPPEAHVLEGSEKELARLASAGRAALNYDVRIVDEQGRDVPVGEVGEIVVRSEAMTMGYWNLPEQTAESVRDGWRLTGDFGRFDEEKNVYIVDRKNDMIISGGKNIYPREVEEVIYKHDAVLDVAVVGVPDDYWGEAVKAIVVLKEGKTATEEEIIGMCKARLASYKKPKTVEFRAELPRSPTGKILKREIRKEYWSSRDRMV
ncbi:MAG: long-chain-fatty-acid--CoA ligase [Deltaproteobacteria bacterium]|jgi:long-chain acyl-CoA synthetase